LRDMPRDPLAEHQRLQEFKRRMGM
jgi:hypothetical protein